MYLRKDTLKIEDGEVKFWLTPNSGNGGFPVNMGRGQARELAEELMLILLEDRRYATKPDALGRLLADVQAEPTLERREAECMAALHSDDAMDANGNA